MKKFTAILLSASMCLSLSLSAFAEGENENPLNSYSASGIDKNLTVTATSKITVAEEADGSNTAFKITGNEGEVVFSLPEAITSGTVKYSFDVKLEAYGTFMQFLPQSSDSKNIYRMQWFYGGIWDFGSDVNKNWIGGEILSSKNNNTYVNYKITVNLDKKTRTVSVNNGSPKTYDSSNTSNFDGKDAKQLKISFSQTAGTGYPANATNVLWVKNVSIKTPVVKSVDISGKFMQGEALTGSADISYDSYTSDTSTYRWLACDTVDGEFTPLDSETNKSITIKEDYLNKFLKLEVTPILDGVQGASAYSKAVCAEAAPVAKKVWVKGSLLNGETLEANMEYFDINGDEEGEHIYNWYSCDENGENRTFLASGKNYTVTDTENIDYIVLGAYAVSKREPYQSQTEVFSDVVKEALPPEAKNVKITGKASVGEVLTGSFDFYDPNNDEEGTHIYCWYRCDDEDGNGKTQIGNEKTYTLTNDDISKYIIFEVKPVAVAEPCEAVKFYASEPFVAPQKPYAANVRITGTATVGNTLTGEYDYGHYFDIPEKGTTYRWLASSSNSAVGASQIGNGATLVLKNEHVGKYVFFEVTPSCYSEPAKGESYCSVGKLVTATSVITPSVTVSSGYSGGGGGGSYKPSSNNTQNNTNSSENKNNSFSDTINHWAKYEIDRAYFLGLVKGMSETQFAPEMSITSAQYLAMIMRAVGISCENKSGNEWYADYVKKATEAGIIDESFAPDSEIIREDMAVIAVKAYEYKTKKTLSERESSFTDKENISSEKTAYVNKAVNAGILKGMDDGSFLPKTMTTRAQSVTVILRLIDALGRN